MKKMISVLVCLLLLCSLALPTLAVPEGPQITLQPQNYHYPEYSVAIFTVKATGTNLHADWYLKFEGKTYHLSDNQNGFEPWEAYAGENYGPIEDANTFGWFFGGIEAGLNGAEIWCVIEDGHYSVTSERAIVTVQGDAMPAEILQFPASVSVNRGQTAEIRCVAKAVGDTQLEYQWYESASGKLQDIRAIDGEESDCLTCSTEKTGTRYYVCCVTSTAGGRVYSSVVPVTVAEPEGKAPTFMTKTLPQGTVGEDYGFTLETDDHGAVFHVYYNPGGANDFDKTGLVLSMEGIMMGQLKKAGTYTFTICVSNDYGEDYGTLTLKVVEPTEIPPETTPTTPTTPDTTPTTPDTTPTTPDTTPTTPDTTPTTPDTTPTNPPAQTPNVPKENPQFPWWGYALLVLGSVGAGIGVVFLFTKLRK